METKPRRDAVTWCGLAVVGGAAAALSYSALDELAQLCGIRWHYLLPATIDVFAATATRIWLRRAAHPDAVRYARTAAWCAIVVTIAGNATHGWLTESHLVAPWWLIVIVSALPAIALGALVHLAVLVGRAVPALDDLAECDPPAQLDQPVYRRPAPLGRRPIPLPADDDALLADLRGWAVELDALPPVDAVRLGYGVGTDRAVRLRERAVNGSAVAR